MEDSWVHREQEDRGSANALKQLSLGTASEKSLNSLCLLMATRLITGVLCTAEEVTASRPLSGKMGFCAFGLFGPHSTAVYEVPAADQGQTSGDLSVLWLTFPPEYSGWGWGDVNKDRRMKMRRYKLFLMFCMAGLCLISFLHFFKTLSYVTFPRELASLSPNLVSSFFWNNAPVTPQASPEPGGPDLLRTPLYSHSPLLQPLSPSRATEELHRVDFVLPEDTTEYFVRTKAGGICFKPGRKWVECVCLPGWHGPSCGVPTVVQYSNLPTKERLVPREVPRRVINAININHEFDLLDVRFHELGDVVDAFVVCESNFTAYGEPRPLKFREMLTNGTFEYIRHKVLYVFLDHFPPGGRQDGWIADDYLRTFLTQDGVSRLRNLRPDDVFIIDDADEIPARDGVLFLKLYDGWTEPFAFHMRKSLYGFFWKQPGTLEVVSGCTVDMLQAVYGLDGIRLRRRQYYTMPNFRQYENRTGHILVQWSLGSPLHFAGWHCSWCFTPEGIYFKLVSAQNGDFPRWGDYEDKRDLNYIRSLIRTGGWFDGTQQEYPPADPSEHMYAPKYLLKNYDQFRYLLDNPYQEPKSTVAGGRRNKGPEGRPSAARDKLDTVEG
ncbi:Beta-1,4-mannosyl-glycoprotein 4-beta-N-acetylglucosaminyltransferase [Fukomys damarensis]|uniref:Beta-1,4-mannosyl-glycoprotein 4-beta-N-acetylglucosaminyltransferase n=2 Tax=Fukomys damarensis TaxID=885580 RepID=A0A091EM36_FUKDA|nr:Beta-1,4-mannosyl-glycoprotein 4-beta-N-acetylglucosaminyltransferase [Fukomys damarensis]